LEAQKHDLCVYNGPEIVKAGKVMKLFKEIDPVDITWAHSIGNEIVESPNVLQIVKCDFVSAIQVPDQIDRS
jgi:hypothetical protein